MSRRSAEVQSSSRPPAGLRGSQTHGLPLRAVPSCPAIAAGAPQKQRRDAQVPLAGRQHGPEAARRGAGANWALPEPLSSGLRLGCSELLAQPKPLAAGARAPRRRSPRPARLVARADHWRDRGRAHRDGGTAAAGARPSRPKIRRSLGGGGQCVRRGHEGADVLDLL